MILRHISSASLLFTQQALNKWNKFKHKEINQSIQKNRENILKLQLTFLATR